MRLPKVFFSSLKSSLERNEEPETKFVGEEGSTLIETEDGSDEVFVVTSNNMVQFESDIIDLIQDSEEGNVDANNKVGEKNGYNLKGIEDNAYVGFPTVSSMGDASFHSGYMSGYGDKDAQPGMNFVLSKDRRDFAITSGQGKKIGTKHAKAVKMNMFKPKLKNQSIPIFNKKAMQTTHPDDLLKGRLINN